MPALTLSYNAFGVGSMTAAVRKSDAPSPCTPAPFASFALGVGSFESCSLTFSGSIRPGRSMRRTCVDRNVLLSNGRPDVAGAANTPSDCFGVYRNPSAGIPAACAGRGASPVPYA